MNTTATTTISTTMTPEIRRRLEAGAFRSLCVHLRERSDLVQNIDLMTVSGFCRNCLSKWLVMEARTMSKSIHNDNNNNDKLNRTQRHQTLTTDTKNLLDAFGYDEAAEEVYGCAYSDWKKSHATKATDDQMVNYKASVPIHAKHEPMVLSKPLTTKDRPASNTSDNLQKSSDVPNAEKDGLTVNKRPPPPSLLSNVCCQDMEPDITVAMSTAPTSLGALNDRSTRQTTEPTFGTFVPPPPPDGPISLTIGILTVSDRAASNGYATGDLSGPRLVESINALVEKMNEDRAADNGTDDLNSPPPLISCDITSKAIVPDETKRIQHHILTWSGKHPPDDDGDGNEEKEETPQTPAHPSCDLIFTTGGTGFSPRDVTPEATLAVLDYECRGLVSFCLAECAVFQPLAALSRGCAGVCGRSMVVNLPGNPSAIGQIVSILFPLLIHAVKDLKGA